MVKIENSWILSLQNNENNEVLIKNKRKEKIIFGPKMHSSSYLVI